MTETVSNKNFNAAAKPVAMHPVVIAGAGPVGCAAALYLAQRNIPVVLLEQDETLPVDLRASTFHPPTLDMLDQLGLTDALIPQGLIVEDWQFRERSTNENAKFQMDHLKGETNHPYRLQCEQWKMTRTVVEMLRQYSHARVEFETRVVGFRDAKESVDVLAVKGAGSEERIRGSFLIGADGAGSLVRQSAGIMFKGLTYPEMFLTFSTKFPFENHFEDFSWVNYVSDPEEWCVLLKTVDLWRVQVPAPLDMATEELLSDDFIESRLQRLVPNPDGYDVHHRTLYKVHQRVAETYRVADRTLIIGDAAHINNPLGGMGMNGGVHDAINLAEKITEIVFESGNMDALLDLFDRQRREICIEFVQKQTKKNKSMLESTDLEARRKRQEMFMDACSSAEKQKEYLMQSSMINSVRESYAIT